MVCLTLAVSVVMNGYAYAKTQPGNLYLDVLSLGVTCFCYIIDIRGEMQQTPLLIWLHK